jgi:hypothetical protein
MVAARQGLNGETWMEVSLHLPASHRTERVASDDSPLVLRSADLQQIYLLSLGDR